MRGVFLFGIWVVLVSVALWFRPLLPVDETRYLAVAWEMWGKESFLVPYLNGETYSHKPPLLFWLIQASWSLFGVNDWTPRLVAPLFGLTSLFLTYSIAKRLWPEFSNTAKNAPLVLVGGLYWAIYTTLTMFDMLVATLTLSALVFLLRACETGRFINWILLGITLGVAGIAKGPVILLYVLPIAFLAPWWDTQGQIRERAGGYPGWYRGIGASVIIGLIVAFSWAGPAVFAGGEEYRNAILWGQTAGRVVNSFAHQQPFWWYVVILPIALLPWVIWPPLWSAMVSSWHNRSSGPDRGLRFCLSWTLPTFIVLSMVSGKQPHYLMPLLPAFALLIARGCEELNLDVRHRDSLPLIALGLILTIGGGGFVLVKLASFDPKAISSSAAWLLIMLAASLYLYKQRQNSIAAVAIFSACLIIVLHGLGSPFANHVYNLKTLSEKIGTLQTEGKTVIHSGKYHGQYQFLGRLSKPLPVVSCLEYEQWTQTYAEGYVLTYKREPMAGPGLLYTQPYRGKQVGLWKIGDTEQKADVFGCG